jgi:hypothetical protein
MKKALMLGLVAALSLAGCGKEAPAEPVVLESSPEIDAMLVAADRVDGTEDRVVSQCPGCGFAMEGSEDHVLEVDDYSVHFCSDRCQKNFAEDPEGSLMALAVEPEAEGGEEEEPQEP